MGCAPSSEGRGRARRVCVGCERLRSSPPILRPGPGSFHAENIVAEKLGRGAYASVYAVQKAAGGEPRFAVKVISLHAAGKRESRDREQMVARELQILETVAEARSNFVVTFFESFVEGLVVYMLMEKCDDTLLEALGGLEEVTEEAYRPIFAGMLSGLADIHAAGVVHRDVKPDNFMCARRGDERVVKLCDFGLAEAVSCASRSELCGVNGTPPFMAPEMVQHSRYSAKVDLWSLGVVVYLLLFGHFPYAPRRWTSEAMKATIRLGMPRPAFVPRVQGRGAAQPEVGRAELAGAVSTRARRLAERLLRRVPGERPGATEALREEFFRPARGGGPSLRPMLRSAELCGAFGTSRSAPDSLPSCLDVKVAELQLQHGHQSAWSRQTTASSLLDEPLPGEAFGNAADSAAAGNGGAQRGGAAEAC